MRILHMTTEFPPVIFGGLGTAVGGLVYASARAGETVGVLLVGGVLAAEGYGRPAKGEGHRDLRAVEGDVAFFQISPEAPVADAARLAAEWRADVVHLHTAWIWPFVEPILSAGIPVVYTVHSVDRAEYEYGREPGHILEHCEDQARAARAADRLVTLTDDETRLLAHYYPDVRERVRVVGNGIDDCAAARSAIERDRGGNPALVLYTGRLVERKGIRDLLAAVPSVLAAAPETRFVLAGGPPGYGGEELARHWLPPACLPYRDAIRFTGWLTPDEVASWYGAAGVQVIPSRYEPFGMVVLEGMLHGLPIVATKLGGPAVILEHGRTGLLVPAWDPGALAAAILRLVKSPQLRRRLGAAAADEVRRNWLWPRIAKRMHGVYRETLAGAAVAA